MAEFSSKDCSFSMLGKQDFRGVRVISYEETQETQGIHTLGGADPVDEVSGNRSVSGSITFTQQGYYDLLKSLPVGKRLGDLSAFTITIFQANESRVVKTSLIGVKINSVSQEMTSEDGIPVVECALYIRRVAQV